ncbi:hypothetical protein [Streptomyces hesseae]|uniref:Uncharacterized protein n=1 Tax=Streptomyces hesseae TaxID=3075519 RepID=A0ABU2SFG3_9ACTN|nr:hypothetical protein [Streptomyces sp. DSM 40473]MDT0447513.1 hypothetical protein [Streptomyces sp. DSM 40473]
MSNRMGRFAPRRTAMTAVATAVVLTMTGAAVAEAAPPAGPENGGTSRQVMAPEYVHIAVDKQGTGLDGLRRTLHENGLRTAEHLGVQLAPGSVKLGHHRHVFMWDSTTPKGIEGANEIEARGSAVRVKIRWNELKEQGGLLGRGNLKGDNGKLGGKSTNGAWAHEGDIPRKYLFIVGVDDPRNPGMGDWLAGKGWPEGHGVCEAGPSGGRSKRSVSACERGEPDGTRPEKTPPGENAAKQPVDRERPGAGTPESSEALEARQVEEAFARLAAKYSLNVAGAGGRKLTPADVHARIRGYTSLSPAAKAGVRAKLRSAGGTAKGALLVTGAALWAKGVHDAFAQDTTSLDKAAAIAAIVPFVGCGTQAGADAEHGRADAGDTIACLGGDALTVSPLWPLGLTVHGARYFGQKWQEAQIPSVTVFQQTRDKAWEEAFQAFRADGFERLVKSALATEREQLEAEKAVILHDAAEEIVAVERRFAGLRADAATDADRERVSANSRILTWSIEKRARERVGKLPEQLRRHYDKAIRDALVERAEQYNEEFVKQQVDIERWKEDSWQSGVAGPRQSREERQKYLDAVVNLLRDTPPPVPHENEIGLGVDRVRVSLERERKQG